MANRKELGLRMAAIGLASFALTGTRNVPPAFGEALHDSGNSQFELKQDERRQRIDIDFRNWPHVVDEVGCSEKYPDMETGSYHMIVNCPRFIAGTNIPGQFTDFDLEIGVEKRSGMDIWYGAVAVENEGEHNEARHLFMLSGNGVFKYQRMAIDPSLRRLETTEQIRPIAKALSEREPLELMGIVRDGRNVYVYYNHTKLFETVPFSRRDSGVNLILHVLTPRDWQHEQQAHVVFHSAILLLPQSPIPRGYLAKKPSTFSPL